MVQTMTKTAGTIQQDVLRELGWDMRVEKTAVGVEVDDGIVTLTGTVGTYATRQAAQEAAHRVRGVLDVVNDLTVKVPGVGALTDTEIAQEVRQTLEWNVWAPSETITTTVADGVVTLEGAVAYWYQRDEIERSLRHHRGVRAIINKVTLSAPAIDTSQVRDAIEQALERRADRIADHLEISAHNGTVSLSGTVRSWQEKENVLAAVRYGQGVRVVEDHVRIDPWA